ncbi:Isochorismatase-like protein [Phaeosphaeria sp. MPI-PUGE-AT-0046c]|nr:Isochorismatase-like protein [Phaeosphaeria sp. MPI-PUGE-AT-0046c]
MPNLLVLSLDGFSASSRQMYPQLFSKILSRTAVHESLTPDDALNYIGSGWPNIILCSDPSFADTKNRELLKAVVDWVKHGCTMICMGFFASTVEYPVMDSLFKEHFGLKWRVAAYTSHTVRLQHTVDENMIRRSSLAPKFDASAVYLGHVPTTEVVYAGGPASITYAAFARIGLGKLGYIGDVNFGEEPERLILAMCHLDRPEDALENLDLDKSALVIIDMQNFFLSSAFGRKQGAGHAASTQLIQHAVPAARKAGIRIIWLNWGLSDADMRTLPPAVKRTFGFYAMPADTVLQPGAAFDDHPGSVSVDRNGVLSAKESAYKGLGSDCGTLTLEDGSAIDAGKLLMRDQWNAALYPPLDTIYTEGTKLPHKPDVSIHKDRMSGLWGAETACEKFLENEGIKTLLFAGVNTDQCVGGTLTDAFSKGYDCVLLSDGCGTTSPMSAQECYEYNAAKTYGFCTTCEALAKGVEEMGK